MDNLSAEILCDIYLKSLPSEREGRGSPGAFTLTQLYISHVCRRWRDLALSFGELWSYLQLDLAYMYNVEDGMTWKSSAEIFDTWLSRSKGTPLKYVLYGIFPRTLHDHLLDRQREAERIIVALLSEQHRWERIWIDFTRFAALPDFPGFVLINMPALISLELSVSSYTFQSTDPFTISLARSSRLKRLIIHGQFDLDSGNVPINTLTEAQLVYRSRLNRQMPQVCLDFLRSAPFLVEFQAVYSPTVSHTVLYSLNGDRVSLSELRTLNLRSHPLFEIIDKLTLPSLEDLTFGDVAREVSAPILRNFLGCSKPPLTSLHIAFGDADALIPSLGLLTALKFLQIHDSKVSEPFFRELVIPVDAGGHYSDQLQYILCPSLADLDFLSPEIRGDKQACIDAIFYMVKSRAEVLGTFKTIEFAHGPQSEITELAINGEGWRIDKFRTLVEESWTWEVKSCM